MFPTKTSCDIEMVGCVSEATGSCMEKNNWWKKLRNKEVYSAT